MGLSRIWLEYEALGGPLIMGSTSTSITTRAVIPTTAWKACGSVRTVLLTTERWHSQQSTLIRSNRSPFVVCVGEVGLVVGSASHLFWHRPCWRNLAKLFTDKDLRRFPIDKQVDSRYNIYVSQLIHRDWWSW